MTKKKPAIWYGIKTPKESTRVFEVEVERETATRLYLTKKQQAGWFSNQTYVNKMSSYELYFRSREEAVAKKLSILNHIVRSAKANHEEAKACLRKFRAQENA
jgi:hypothetical protein